MGQIDILLLRPRHRRTETGMCLVDIDSPLFENLKVLRSQIGDNDTKNVVTGDDNFGDNASFSSPTLFSILLSMHSLAKDDEWERSVADKGRCHQNNGNSPQPFYILELATNLKVNGQLSRNLEVPGNFYITASSSLDINSSVWVELIDARWKEL